MAQSAQPITIARRDQMFPILAEADIERMRRFGEASAYAPGEHIVTAGEVAPGLIVILSGTVDITQDAGLGRRRETIVTHGAGNFIGELAQLSSRPSLVNAEATQPVEAFVIPSQRLRDLMVQEANLGERIMRALILRRVGLLESGTSDRSSSDPPAMATCCGCRVFWPAAASRTGRLIPTPILAPKP